MGILFYIPLFFILDSDEGINEKNRMTIGIISYNTSGTIPTLQGILVISLLFFCSLTRYKE